MLDTHARKYTDRLFRKLAGGFLRLGLQPNHITAAAFVLGCSAGAVLYTGYPIAAMGLLWLSGLLDATDGEMARLSGKSSLYGALLDIVSDRVVELSIVWGLALRRVDCLLPLLLSLVQTDNFVNVAKQYGDDADSAAPRCLDLDLCRTDRIHNFAASGGCPPAAEN